MRPIHNFIIKPYGQRYNNSTKVGDKDLITTCLEGGTMLKVLKRTLEVI